MAKNLSRRLSYVLRHNPGSIGLTADSAGWVGVEELLAGLRARGRPVDRQQLDRCVATNNKQRFEFADDGARIRARQGHSFQVDLGYAPSKPPPRLFHGTFPNALASIRDEGLIPRNRHHVHLSADRRTAIEVGARRGRPVLLEVDAFAMAEAGHTFFVTGNGVWLTDAVPPGFIQSWGDLG